MSKKYFIILVFFFLISVLQDASGGENWICKNNFVMPSEISLLMNQASAPSHSYCTSEAYIKELAAHEKRSRKRNGIVGLFVGSMAIGTSIILNDDYKDTDQRDLRTINNICGAASIMFGIYSLTAPSQAEREAGYMRKISDLEAREEYGAEALKSMAYKARIMRALDCMTNFLIAGMYVSTKPFGKDKNNYLNYVAGALSFTFAIATLATRPEADKLNEKYERARNGEVEYKFGMDGRGGGQVTISYSF